MTNSRAIRVVAAVAFFALVLPFVVTGCGKKSDGTDGNGTEGRPEWVTAYEALQFCTPAANKWEAKNWCIQIKDGDPESVNREGKARIWEVYFFSPRPEENSQMFVIYNRGHVWPNTPGPNKGGEQGTKIYREERPPDFRVDSPEAYNVGTRNGGGEYLQSHKDAQVHVTLRCKADYDAVEEKMPAPKYKWIWDVTYREPRLDSEVLHLMVDGMNGDFITKETKQGI